MVLPRPRGRRLRLEPLEDRLTPADAAPLLASPRAEVAWTAPVEAGEPDGPGPAGRRAPDGDTSGPATGPRPTVLVGLLAVARRTRQDAVRDEAAPPGPAPAPAVSPPFAQITDRNRNSLTMLGGWNPALRGILVMNDGSRWFAAETGTSTAVNSAMVYYRLGADGWKAVGSVALPPGVQQNMAVITNGRTIFAYGVTRGAVIETRFDTARPRWNLVTGNALTASGRVIVPGTAANYVGAVWRNNARVVWWASVGPSGAGGKWFHTFNVGGGWNGPFVSGLGGYGSLGYVRARVDDQGRLRMLAEGHVGKYPAGRFDLLEATLTLGRPTRWARVLPAVGHTPVDLWPGAGGATHYLYRTNLNMDTVGYWYGPTGGPGPVTFHALEGRFVAAGDRLALILGYRHALEVRLVSRSAAAAGPIDWAAVPPLTIPLPAGLGAGGLSAIWTADEPRQPRPSDRLEFAIAGGYPAHDHLIYHVTP